MTARPSNLEDRFFDGLRIFIAIGFLGMILLPFLYALSISIRPPTEVFGDVHWIPYQITLDSWKMAFDDMSIPLINSTIIAAGTAVLSLIITIPGAYVFGRKEFPGKKFGFYLIIVSLLFPYILLIIPITDMWYDLELFNTIPGLWLAYQVFVTPFAVWILRDYFEKLPYNLEEAARVYGCTHFSAFVRVILPLSAPAIAAVGFLSFNVGWNDFLFSNMLTTGTGPRPAVVVLFNTTYGGENIEWSLVMAETLIIGLPPTIFYIVARRHLTNAFDVS